MISQADPKFRSTRTSRTIDYTSVRVIRKRAADKGRQRDQSRVGAWVIGRFVFDPASGRVFLEGIFQCYRSFAARSDSDPLTMQLADMARWNSRQAARWWLTHHPRADCMLINVHRARFVDPTFQNDKPPAVAVPSLSAREVGRDAGDRPCRIAKPAAVRRAGKISLADFQKSSLAGDRHHARSDAGRRVTSWT